MKRSIGVGLVLSFVLVTGCMQVHDIKSGKTYELTANGLEEKESIKQEDDADTAKKEAVVNQTTDYKCYHGSDCLRRFDLGVIPLDLESASGRMDSFQDWPKVYGGSAYRTVDKDSSRSLYEYVRLFFQCGDEGRGVDYLEVELYRYTPISTKIRIRYNPHVRMEFGYERDDYTHPLMSDREIEKCTNQIAGVLERAMEVEFR